MQLSFQLCAKMAETVLLSLSPAEDITQDINSPLPFSPLFTCAYLHLKCRPHDEWDGLSCCVHLLHF